MIRQANKKIALQILTSNSQTEKKLFFEVLQKFRSNEIDTVRKILVQTFPELSKYLSSTLDGQNIFSPEQEKYFAHYRWLKVTNRITEDFIQRVKEISLNNGENIFSLESRNKIITEEYTDETAIAPKETGKSYIFSKISKYGWLISGGSITRAKMFFDMNKRTAGLVSHYNYVAFD